MSVSADSHFSDCRVDGDGVEGTVGLAVSTLGVVVLLSHFSGDEGGDDCEMLIALKLFMFSDTVDETAEKNLIITILLFSDTFEATAGKKNYNYHHIHIVNKFRPFEHLFPEFLEKVNFRTFKSLLSLIKIYSTVS